MILSCVNDKPADNFHGMWRMVRHEVRDSISQSWSLDSTRLGLTGYVVYDGLGNMGVQQVKAPNDSSENNSDIVYFATYILLENGMIQHTKLSSNFDDAGVTVKRRYEFRGDTLLLTPEEANGRVRTVWVRERRK